MFAKCVIESLEFLRGIADRQFVTEEDSMRKHNYPFRAEHEKQHAEFMEKYSAFTEEFNEVGASQELADDILDMVSGWVQEHVTEHDIHYAGYAGRMK